MVNLEAVQVDPKSWGADARLWRPDRWIVKSEGGEEELMQPAHGTFAPWADGPRVCPGRKFAQVEFVACLATVFQNHRVRPVGRDGGVGEDPQAKALAMVRDSAVTSITLQMRNPEAVPLAWTIEPRTTTTI